MSAKTFEEWRSEMDRKAHNQISLLEASLLNEGWDAGQESLRAALLADAPDVARVAREYRDNAAKYPIDSEAGQRLGFVAHCIESLVAQSAVQQARIKELEDRLEIPKWGAHKHLDGLALRDETICLQDVCIRQLERELAQARAENKALQKGFQLAFEGTVEAITTIQREKLRWAAKAAIDAATRRNHERPTTS